MRPNHEKEFTFWKGAPQVKTGEEWKLDEQKTTTKPCSEGYLPPKIRGEGKRVLRVEREKEYIIYQIITSNSKYDSTPICRYREEGVEGGDIDNCIGSTETKGEKSQCGSGFWTCLERERERVCWVEGTG